MALLSVQSVPRNNGVTVTETAAASSDEFPNAQGSTFLLIVNSNASPTTITVTGVKEPKYGRTGNRQYVVPASSVGIAGPFDQDGFNAADGNIDIAASSTTSLTYGVLEISKGMRL